MSAFDLKRSSDVTGDVGFELYQLYFCNGG